MSKHTPGEFLAVPPGRSYVHWQIITAGSRAPHLRHEVLAKVYTSDPGLNYLATPDEAEANAHLFAAAPELLEVVNAFVVAAKMERLHRAWKILIDAGEAVLRKARGK